MKKTDVIAASFFMLQHVSASATNMERPYVFGHKGEVSYVDLVGSTGGQEQLPQKLKKDLYLPLHTRLEGRHNSTAFLFVPEVGVIVTDGKVTLETDLSTERCRLFLTAGSIRLIVHEIHQGRDCVLETPSLPPQKVSWPKLDLAATYSTMDQKTNIDVYRGTFQYATVNNKQPPRPLQPPNVSLSTMSLLAKPVFKEMYQRPVASWNALENGTSLSMPRSPGAHEDGHFVVFVNSQKAQGLFLRDASDVVPMNDDILRELRRSTWNIIP